MYVAMCVRCFDFSSVVLRVPCPPVQFSLAFGKFGFGAFEGSTTTSADDLGDGTRLGVRHATSGRVVGRLNATTPSRLAVTHLTCARGTSRAETTQRWSTS